LFLIVEIPVSDNGAIQNGGGVFLHGRARGNAMLQLGANHKQSLPQFSSIHGCCCCSHALCLHQLDNCNR